MKNLLRILIITAITSFALSSCSDKISITKRKYNRGYYVSHSNKRGDVKRPAQAPELKLEAPVETEIVLAKPPTQQNKVTESDPSLSASTARPIDNNKIMSSKKVHIDRQVNKKYLKVKQLEKLMPSATYSSDIKKRLNAQSDSEALSLLWIVIVVVLILYLLGLLFGGFGLGGAIHVLAVIFLVLLILWLLRVI